MRKLLMLLLSFAITLTFAGCTHKTAKLDYTAVLQAAESQRESAAPESAQTEAPEQEATAGHASSVTNYDFSYADIADVFANEDSYIGKVYAGPFQITGDLQKAKDKWVTVGIAYSKNKDVNYYAFLKFDGAEPYLKKGEIVFAYGILEGTTQVESKKGDYQLPFLILSVNKLETELPDTAGAARKTSFSFTDAACAGTQDTLSIELYNLTFSKDGMMVSTKAMDSAVTGRTTYYMDIYAHQDGHFVWYPDCDFWVVEDLISFDNVPLRSLDPSQDLVLEFFPFSEKGKLLYPAIAIPVPLSQQQK